MNRQPVFGIVVSAGSTLLVAAVAALALEAGGILPPFPAPVALGTLVWPTFVAFILVFFFFKQQGFVFYWRNHSTKTSLDEIALFLGVLVLPLPHVVAGVAVASALTQVRHRRDPAKAIFNVTQYTVSAALAAGSALALQAVGVPAPWFALPAPVVFAFSTAALVSVLFSRMNGTTPMAVFRERLGRSALAGASMGVSLGVVVVALWSLAPLAVVAAAPVFFYLRRFGTLSEWADDEIKTHQLLASVSSEVAGQSDAGEVADRILNACHELFDCGEAQVTIQSEAGGTQVWRRRFGAKGAGAGGITAAVVYGDNQRIGEITVFPQPGQRPFGEREQHLLKTVAASAAAAAANARALRLAESANRDLLASESRYRRLFETANVFIHVLDAKGRVVEVNSAAVAALGQPRSEMIGRQMAGFVAPDDQAAFEGAFDTLEVSGQLRGVEVRLVSRAGDEIYVLFDATALEGSSDDRRFVVFSRDITSLKSLESDLRRSVSEQKETIRRLENMNRELEEFTLWTTHDMREPLRSVGTMAQFLHEDLGNITMDEAREMAKRIAEGAERLKDRVKGLHAFSRIVQRDEAFADVNVHKAVMGTIAALETKIAEKNAAVRIVGGPLPVVRAQPHRIDQIFANLIENALKYGTSMDAPIVEIGCERGDGEWRFFVRDNGPGVPAEYRDRIFQLFQRGPNPVEAGSGTGLAIVKRVVEQHGGRVWVEDAPAGGACFRFTLPADVATVVPAPTALKHGIFEQPGA